MERPLYFALAFVVACSPPPTSTPCHSERSEGPAFAFAVAVLLRTPPQNDVISTGAQRSGETPVFRSCFCRWLFSNTLAPRCPQTIPPLSRTYPRSCFLLKADQQIPNIHAPIPTPQTIFHAFTQQNRMSSPQTHQKTNNSLPINKIKVCQKWFLVMVNQVQLN